MQLALSKKYHLPLFLHSRAAHADFVQILREEGFGENGGRAVGGMGGVVHSFTGLPEELADLVGCSSSLRGVSGTYCMISSSDRDGFSFQVCGGFLSTVRSSTYLILRSVNGCSLKTAENIEAARQIPLDLLMLETGMLSHFVDQPWCMRLRT